jgi:hypothetical protein
VIVCTACGHTNADDAQFCESCQEFLEWSGKRVAEDEDVVDGAPVADDAAPAEHAPVGAPQVETSEPEPVAVVPQEPSGRAAPAPSRSDDVSDTQPAAVRPREEYRPPGPVVPEPSPEPEPGELICDQCGRGNRAEANFCRNCGASLAGAAIARQPPWWRRLLGRRGRTYQAGERRRRGTNANTGLQRVQHGSYRVARLLGLLATLGIVSVAAIRGDVVGHSRDGIDWIRRTLFPRYEPAIPTRFKASKSLPGHPARLAFDKNRTSFWAEGAAGDGRGQKIVARFDRVVDIARVGFLVGDQSKPQNFVNSPVPHRLRLRFFDRNGKIVGRKVLFLAQKPDFQRFTVEAKDVTRVGVTIVSVYHSPKGHAAAIAEIEFFEKD